MPTISERLAALFSRDMRTVLRNPRAISMLANPSARVQMAAVRRDRSVICFIDKPVEKVQLAAVRNAPHNIHFITSPSERVQLSVIRARPSYIGFIPDPSEKVQLAAVERRPECVALIRKPAERVQLMAVLKDPRHIASIREPAMKVQLAAVQKDPGIHPPHRGTRRKSATHGHTEESGCPASHKIPCGKRAARGRAGQGGDRRAPGGSSRRPSSSPPSEAIHGISVILRIPRRRCSLPSCMPTGMPQRSSAPAEEVKRQAASLYGLELGKDAGKKTREARTRGSSAAPVKRTAARKTGRPQERSRRPDR